MDNDIADEISSFDPCLLYTVGSIVLGGAIEHNLNNGKESALKQLLSSDRMQA